MRIKNIEGLSPQQIQEEVTRGARFVYYQFTVSVILFSFKRNSDVYFIRQNENPVNKALPFTLLTLFLGWWGIPFGPIYSIESLRANFKGGKDVTDEVMATVAGHILFQETERTAATRY